MKRWEFIEIYKMLIFFTCIKTNLYVSFLFLVASMDMLTWVITVVY